MEAPGMATEFGQRHRTALTYMLSALTGLAAGAIIVAYRSSIAFVERIRADLMPELLASAPALGLWLTLIAAASYLTYRLVRARPLIKGSGIPQVKAMLTHRVKAFWGTEIPAKFAGGVLALGTGLSLGREGPSIHLGALLGQGVAELSRRRDLARFLITAGGAAGISAAFNAPLAGVLFCVEELHRSVSPTMLTASLIASFAANAVMWLAFGNAPVFAITLDSVLPLNSYFSVILLIGVGTGLLGWVFNHGILVFQSLSARWLPRPALRMLFIFLAGACVALALPLVSGGGEHLIDHVVETRPSWGPIAALLAAKLAFTLFSYASGAPGGIFLPMLAIGALAGAMSHSWLAGMGVAGTYLHNCVLLGMAGFFTAVVRAPITGAVLITEMAGSFAHFPAFIFVSVTAALTAGALRTKPIYDSLLARLEGGQPGHESRPVVIHVPVMEGSVFDTCGNAAGIMPEGCVLAAIERGDDELFPAADLDIQPGDTLRVVAESSRASRLKEQLLDLASTFEDAEALASLDLASLVRPATARLLPEDGLDAMRGALAASGDPVLPVFGTDGGLLGILSANDVKNALFDRHVEGAVIVLDVMRSPEPARIPGVTPAELFGLYERAGLNALPAVDGKGVFSGFIFRADVVNAYRAAIVS